MTTLPRQQIFEHPVVAAWMPKLHPADQEELVRTHGDWIATVPADKVGHRPYFYFALACLDATPVAQEPSYALPAGGCSWLEELVYLYRKIQSDVLIQLALDCASTATDLRLLADSPDMQLPWSVLDLTDYSATQTIAPGNNLQALAFELAHLQADRLRQLAPEHTALEEALAAKRLELSKDFY